MLTVSMGVVFQFILGRIKKINKDIAKVNSSVSKLHEELFQNRNSIAKSSQQKNKSYKNKQLTGNLELEYNGSKAYTRATFYIDKER